MSLSHSVPTPIKQDVWKLQGGNFWSPNKLYHLLLSHIYRLLLSHIALVAVVNAEIFAVGREGPHSSFHYGHNSPPTHTPEGFSYCYNVLQLYTRASMKLWLRT